MKNGDKYRGQEVWFVYDSGCFVTYSHFDMGAKYKVYDSQKRLKTSFTSIIEATNYAEKMFA